MLLKTLPLKTLLAAALCLASVVAQAQTYATNWTTALKSRARLVSAGEISPGHYLAGFEIELAANTITYWRNPGDAGLPPTLSLEGSKNLGASKLRFPAPKILSEGGTLAFGYSGRVILPLEITAQDAPQPVVLAFSLDYAVCEKICIPAKASGSLTLLKDQGPLAAPIQAAFDTLPKSQALAANAPLSILSARVVAGAKPQLNLEVRAPEGAPAELFVEGPEGFYATMARTAPNSFTLTTVDLPKNLDAAATLLEFTLVFGDSAIETKLHLDGTPAAP